MARPSRLEDPEASYLTTQLDAIEAELRRLGYLKDSDASPDAVTSAFGGNQMSFDQWLGHVFLPNAREAVATKNLPKTSFIGIAAIRNYDGVREASHLVSLLCTFDDEVTKLTT